MRELRQSQDIRGGEKWLEGYGGLGLSCGEDQILGFRVLPETELLRSVFCLSSWIRREIALGS